MRKLPLAVSLTALLLPASATAQSTAPSQTAVDVQNFWPSGGPSQSFALRNADVQPHLALGFSLIANYMYRPLVFTDVRNPMTTYGAVNHAATTDFLWSFGLFDRLQLSLAIPLVVAQEGVGASVFNTMASPLPLTAIRDVRYDIAVAILRRERTTNASGVGLRVDVGGTIPTGDRNGYQGAPTATFAPMLVGDVRFYGITITLNAGARVRELAAVGGLAWASQFYVGGGVAYRPTMFNRLSAGVDVQALIPLHGAVQVMNNGMSSTFNPQMPMEIFFGARYAIDRGRDIEAGLGGGLPLTNAATNPAFRVLASISYTPRATDDDRDGVRDSEDECPTVAEDRDGFEDTNGCPEPDNDGDTILDTNDRCLNEPEDADNFQDNDGCPDPDNDGDGILDSDDQCSTEAAGERPDPERNGCPIRDRDGDGVLDENDRCVDTPQGERPDPARNGCPMPDQDRDGVADAQDQCIGDPAGEHPDRFRAGCPDPDRDHDGVANEVDRCVDQAETINGTTDDDGCPDDGAETTQWAGPVLVFQNAIRLPARMRTIPARQRALFVQAAQRIRARGAEVERLHVWVVPAPGPAGTTEATRLATLVADALRAANVTVPIEPGVPPPPQPPQGANPPPRPTRPTPQPVGELRLRAVLRRPATTQ